MSKIFDGWFNKIVVLFSLFRDVYDFAWCIPVYVFPHPFEPWIKIAQKSLNILQFCWLHPFLTPEERCQMKEVLQINQKINFDNVNLESCNEKIIRLLKNNENNFITNKQIIGTLNLKIVPFTLRRIIKFLRNKGNPIIASTNGYCFATDQNKINNYIIDRSNEINDELKILGKLLPNNSKLGLLINEQLTKINEINKIRSFNKKPLSGFWNYLIYDLTQNKIVKSRRELCKKVLKISHATFSDYENHLFSKKYTFKIYGSTFNYFKKIIDYLYEIKQFALVKHYLNVFMEYLFSDLLN